PKPCGFSERIGRVDSAGCVCLVVLSLGDFRDSVYRWILRRRYSARIRRSLSGGHSSFAAATLLHSASAAKIRALEFAHPRIARGRFAQNESGNRKVAGESLSRDVLADHMGAWRHRSDVIDSIEAGGPNLPGHSSALPAASCAN